MISHFGQQIITIHILPNVSRSKGNQTMKFGQLIEYSARNIFLQKSCRKWDRETVPDYLSFKKVLYKINALVGTLALMQLADHDFEIQLKQTL